MALPRAIYCAKQPSFPYALSRLPLSVGLYESWHVSLPQTTFGEEIKPTKSIKKDYKKKPSQDRTSHLEQCLITFHCFISCDIAWLHFSSWLQEHRPFIWYTDQIYLFLIILLPKESFIPSYLSIRVKRKHRPGREKTITNSYWETDRQMFIHWQSIYLHDWSNHDYSEISCIKPMSDWAILHDWLGVLANPEGVKRLWWMFCSTFNRISQTFLSLGLTLTECTIVECIGEIDPSHP